MNPLQPAGGVYAAKSRGNAEDKIQALQMAIGGLHEQTSEDGYDSENEAHKDQLEWEPAVFGERVTWAMPQTRTKVPRKSVA